MVQDDGAQQDTLFEHVNIQLATANQLMYEHLLSLICFRGGGNKG